MYGSGNVIRKYGFFPKIFPLYIFSQHGPNQWDYIPESEKNHKFPFMFVYSNRMKISFDKLRKKSKCFVIKSPFVTFRQKNKIEQLKNAKGTLIFFAHSLENVDLKISYDDYFAKLESMEKKYFPFSICFHYADVNKGIHKKFMSKGYNCYSAGHPLDPKFTERFYNILKQHKYSMSNSYGSYAMYSTEMGIPFSIFDAKVKFYNNGNYDYPNGELNFTNLSKQFNKVTRIFQNKSGIITDEQKKLVIDELGLKSGISRLKMCFILYVALAIYIYKEIIYYKLKSIKNKF